MQTIIFILAVVITLAALSFAAFKGKRKNKPVMKDPICDIADEFEDEDEFDGYEQIKLEFEERCFDYKTESLDTDSNTDSATDSHYDVSASGITGKGEDVQLHKKLNDKCAISIIDGYYGFHGVAALADFLTRESSNVSEHKITANHLLRWAISYVKFFVDEKRPKIALILELFVEAENGDGRTFSRKMGVLEEIKKTHKQAAVYCTMRSDLIASSFSYPDETNCEVINLAIEALLPYASGYTIVRDGDGFRWKLTNINKHIAAKARQRDWQRRTLSALQNLDNSIERLIHTMGPQSKRELR